MMDRITRRFHEAAVIRREYEYLAALDPLYDDIEMLECELEQAKSALANEERARRETARAVGREREKVADMERALSHSMIEAIKEAAAQYFARRLASEVNGALEAKLYRDFPVGDGCDTVRITLRDLYFSAQVSS